MPEASQNNDLFKLVEKFETNAQNFGFYWEHIDQLIEQIHSECLEVQEAWQQKDRAHLQEEIGDLIQASICLAVFCHFDPHDTLLKSVEKFQKRYAAMVALVKNDGYVNLQNQPMEVLMQYWNKAKKESL
ncbi:MazG nucleotide pyrophosphohydrolase domain-containing protein [Parachlamydia sp. AcF125]|uniref:MazG nucleotide pyrophosphohydrolase domain-containing protein n=1 Tax=Parachlamydia sp. AcF125 TaxID=2795736 RepID=UPI001BC92DC2|nr:MazG nucleotide pyrophosphohydrolase domain-containing protein [Parachlamydia sp. AcF125]MBS4168535.1 Nucleoside triphosphate pyrophosphohydrolase/pyrophosphatase MazG [Parachlamydia sp. AcF125]